MTLSCFYTFLTPLHTYSWLPKICSWTCPKCEACVDYFVSKDNLLAQHEYFMTGQLPPYDEDEPTQIDEQATNDDEHLTRTEEQN